MSNNDVTDEQLAAYTDELIDWATRATEELGSDMTGRILLGYIRLSFQQSRLTPAARKQLITMLGLDGELTALRAVRSDDPNLN